MDPNLLELSPWRTAVLAAVPLLYAAAAVAALMLEQRPGAGWRIARWSAASALFAALLSFGGLVTGSAALWRGPALVTLGDAGALQFGLRSDALGSLMLALVGFIGWVIVSTRKPTWQEQGVRCATSVG